MNIHINQYKESKIKNEMSVLMIEIRWEVAGKEKDLRKEKTQIMINEYKKKREKEGKAVPEEDENKNRW